MQKKKQKTSPSKKGEPCVICTQDDYSSINPMVSCDICKNIFHIECYGYPIMIKSDLKPFFCVSCQEIANGENPQCVLCPNNINSPLKRTTDFHWAHIACALWIPECYYRLGDGREPIDYLQINKERFNKTCCYCNKNTGAVVQCSDNKCKRLFHVICGIKNICYYEYKSVGSGGVVVTLCHIHGERWIGKRHCKSTIRAV